MRVRDREREREREREQVREIQRERVRNGNIFLLRKSKKDFDNTQ